jgi:hypothetical protein
MAVCPSARDTAPARLRERRHLCLTCSEDFLLSFGNHMRYKRARTTSPLPTLSSARRIGLGRVGNDL